MKKLKPVLGCLIPLVALVWLGWSGLSSLLKAPETVVRLESVSRGVVEVSVTETGAIEPLRKVEVKSKVAGRIAQLLVDEGMSVTAGQVLAEIDPTEINSQVAQMAAQVDAQRARLSQSRHSEQMQKWQSSASVSQAEAGLRSAESRLLVAQEQLRVQPEYSNSDIAQAEANLKASQDALALLVRSTQPQAKADVQTGVDDAQASEDVARRNLERQRNLLDRGFVSEQVVDTARSQHASSLARLEQAKKRLELIDEQQRLQRADGESRVAQMRAALDRAKAAKSEVTVRQRQLEAAKADVSTAKAQLESARAALTQDAIRGDEVLASRASLRQLENQLSEVKVRQGDTTIVAPMAGVITRRYMEQGELVTSAVSSFSSGTPVFQVGSLDRMIVKSAINEVDVFQVRTGLPVEIQVDGAPGKVFRGRVRKVAPASQNASNAQNQSAGGGAGGAQAGVIRFSVEVEIIDPDPRIRPGMSAKLTFVIDRRKDVIRVPAACVEGTGAKGSVQIATQSKVEGKLKTTYASREVTVGLRGKSHIEILSGLKEGEKLKPGLFKGPARRALEMDGP